MAIQISDEMIIMTEENVVQDQPCNFISKGNFDNLFKDENIAFDSEKGKFIVQ
jgi:iron complex transport system ATP-binding protein